VLYLNYQDPVGVTAFLISKTDNTAAPQTTHVVTIGATSGATSGTFGDFFYGKLSEITTQPFITSGIWDLNIFCQPVNPIYSYEASLNYFMYIVDGSTANAGGTAYVGATAVPGTRIFDTVNPSSVPPINLPSNVTQITPASSYPKIFNGAKNQITSSGVVDYADLSVYTNPYLQAQIYLQNITGATAFDVKLFYQSAATYSHLHTTFTEAGPTGPQGIQGIQGVTGATGVSNPNATNVNISSGDGGSTFYPVFSGAAGSGQTLYIDNVTTPLTYVPSSGTLSASTYNVNRDIVFGPGNSTSGIRISGYTASGITASTKSILINGTTGNIQIPNNSIVIAGGTGVSSGFTGNATHIFPIRGVTGNTNLIGYDPSTFELTYNSEISANYSGIVVSGASGTVATNRVTIGSNVYNTYTYTGSTGSITFSSAPAGSTINLLLVGGGGGGGGNDAGGGGGGGEVLFVSNIPIGASAYTATIGAGGAGGAGTNGGSGADTTMIIAGTTFRSKGGAGGAASGANGTNANTGGVPAGTSSGGGAGTNNNIAGTGAITGGGGNLPYVNSSPAFYANNGGSTTGTGSGGSAAGGGGAAGPGGSLSVTGSTGAAGGAGLAVTMDGTLRTLGGGGGGGGRAGVGGTGANGGNGGATGSAPTAGNPNSGNGGGGAGGPTVTTGATGGSGIVIISVPYSY
jgi:hypothetical protein